MTVKTNRILLGQIGAAHGIKGEVRIATHTQDPLAIGRYGPLDTDQSDVTITLSKMRLQKNVVVAHIKGISDRTAAEKLNRALPRPLRHQGAPRWSDSHRRCAHAARPPW